ncbi:MAG: DegT/DnrJ/EryC1/StrS family aminotransferase, partial [Candidatus Woesebacteria bacterium]|nr:DegT/DnrJ/EryC1/StrS family aminotransferase [Candidatus Woesebacteria bacterium]
AHKRYSVKHYQSYDCLYPGFKYNLTDIASSIGIHQLKRIKQNAVIRKNLWNIYNKYLSDIHGITLPLEEDKNTYHARHLYAILLPLERLRISRDRFVDLLIKSNIGSGVHFNPVHLHKYYRETYGYKKGDFPNAEYIGERMLSLPLGANLRKQDVMDVVREVKSIFSSNYK